MDYPEWITPANLGSYAQDYSFEVNPLTLSFGAGVGSTVTQINGGLPNGLRLERSADTIRILGACVDTSSDIDARFTLRIIQTNGNIADRTFFIKLTKVQTGPSWANQSTFLGYQNNTLPQAYQLTATVPAGEYITYSIQSVVVTPLVAVSISINPTTGLLSCNAANVIVNNTTIAVTVRAATTLYSDITCTIEVITIPSAPEWVTPAGTLGTYVGEEFVEINLFAKDLNDNLVTYSLLSNPSNVPLDVTENGLLYGRLPNVLTEVEYTLVIGATNSNGTSTRTFIIRAVPSDAISLLQWTTDSDLGSIDEAGYYTIPINATTKRASTIVYNVTGGVLPPNMILAKTDAKLEGFCEYHAVPKLYSFNVSANDGYQTITRQFNLQVNKVYNDVFFGINIPLMGYEKSSWVIDASNVRVREPGTQIFDTFFTIDNPPTLNVIRGVLTGYDSANKIYNTISPWLHQLDLQIGSAANTVITSNNTLVYRHIEDFQKGANVSVYSNAVYNTNVQTSGIVTPISIENIRKTLTEDRSFIDSGMGSGLVLDPVLNWSTGSLTSVKIINTGQNYWYPPSITVFGSGTGAKVRAILGLVGIKILNGGVGWVVGDVIKIDIGRELSYAQITVTQIGTLGDIISYTLDYSGDYLQVPIITSYTFNKDSNSAVELQLNWGIVSIEVISGGQDYQGNIYFEYDGKEILPWWQSVYFPAISVGNINGISGSTASTILNYSSSELNGYHWQPNYMVFSWEGIRWIGSSTFDENLMTLDGDLTRFEETESVYDTIFDDKKTYFDENYTIFDYKDPLVYDQASVWGSTIFDNLLTIFDYYSTAFDRASPKKTSNTIFNKLIRVNNKTYSGNNAVW